MSILESFLAGKEARRVEDAAEQINAMQSFIGQNGQAIMAGDQNALGQLAGFGVPGMNMAMTAQSNAQDRQYREEDRAIRAEDRQFRLEDREAAKAEAKRAAAEALAANAAALTKEQLAAEQKRLSGVLAGASPLVEAGDEAAYNAYVASNGYDPKQYPMKDFQSNAIKIEGTIEAIIEAQEAFGTPDPADEYGRYVAEETAKGNVPLDRIGFSNAKAGNGITSTTTNADGTTTTVQVGGSATANPGGRTGKPTEGSLASEGYLQRMKGAEEIFTELEKAGTTALGYTDRPAVDTDLEGWKLTEPEQRLLQAQRDWVRAKLRKESGAVIGPEEMASEIKQYFPQPGEGPKTAAQKKEARKRAEEQLRITALLPPAAPAADDGTGIGTIEDGFRYIGGDASTPDAWEPVQ